MIQSFAEFHAEIKSITWTIATNDDLDRKKKPLQFKSHSLANQPLKALKAFEKTQRFEHLPNLKEFPSALKTPILRVACISNVFDQTTKLSDACPPADVLIIAGNLSRRSRWNDFEKFRQTFNDLPVKHIVFVPGNADLAFNLDQLNREQINQCEGEIIRQELKRLGLKHLSDYFPRVIYLEDIGVEICGVKFFGSPWVSCDKSSAFYASRSTIMNKWNNIPRGIDVLITCQPPLGHGDADYNEEHIGDVDLLGTVTCRVAPDFHIFGCSREGLSDEVFRRRKKKRKRSLSLAFGISFNGSTYFINASLCTRSYNPSNDFITIDLPLSSGISKSKPNISFFTGLNSK